jgi:YD repeat-containing protein
MPLIECKLGPTTQHVAGTPYTFEYDEHRRAVAEVHNLVHVQCFLSVEHYQEAPATPAPAPVSPDDITELPWLPRAGLILGLGEDAAASEEDGEGAGSQDDSAPDDEAAPATPAPAAKPARKPRSKKAS